MPDNTDIPARYRLDEMFLIGLDKKTQKAVKFPRNPTVQIIGCRYVVVYLAKK